MNKNSYVWVWSEDEDENRAEPFACAPSVAVEKWARARDRSTNEFEIARGEEVGVVLARTRGTVRRFIVIARQEIVYLAMEIES